MSSMDCISARLSKLSVKNQRRNNKSRRGKPQDSALSSPPSGLKTPASGLQTPASRVASRSSGLATPSEATEPESEDEEEEHSSRKRFPFFALPYELRRKVLLSVMQYPEVVDLGVRALKRLSLMLVSRQWYNECCEAFYGGNMFRLLPLDGALHKKRTKPILYHFTPRNRGCVTRLELRLGPHWAQPPLCWQIDDNLGLEDLTSVRRLDLFVQTDPEHPSFVGFRRTKDFYTNYCGELLEEILDRMPRVETVSIDSWPSVGRDSPLVRRLESEALAAEKKIVWGVKLRLDDCYDRIFPSDQATVYDTVPIRQLIIDQD